VTGLTPRYLPLTEVTRGVAFTPMSEDQHSADGSLTNQRGFGKLRGEKASTVRPSISKAALRKSVDVFAPAQGYAVPK